MDNGKLDRYLQSVGKGYFVKYFGDFTGDLSFGAVVDLLMKNEGYAEKASRTRVSKARRIINAGRAGDAMRVIGESSRVPESIRDRAMTIAGGLR